MKRKLFSIACMVLSIILMALPFGIPMIFAPGPEERVTQYYSYFSMIPIGYGNWSPILTAFLSVVILILLFISFKKEMNRVIMTCLCLIFFITLASWILFHAFSILGLAIFLLHVSVCLLRVIHPRGAE